MMWGGVGATSEERRPTIEIPTHYDTNKIFTASCESIFSLLGAGAETISYCLEQMAALGKIGNEVLFRREVLHVATIDNPRR